MGKLTKAQKELLHLATQSADGNPWCMIGARQRTGGGKRRMFDAMQKNGLFDTLNRITDAGRQALSEGEQQ